MKQPLKITLKEKLGEKQLDKEQLKKLADLQQKFAGNSTPQTQTNKKKEARKYRRFHPAYAIAATILLTLSVLFFNNVLSPAFNSPLTKQEMFTAIADEVVKNHLHLKPLEVKTQNIIEIQNYFDRLNFRPVKSQVLNDMLPLELLGGRYCSIQGVTAAQLRFKSIKGKDIHTLYQVPYDQKVFNTIPNIDKQERPVSLYSKGIKVTLWQEKGILFALTAD